MLKFAQEGLSQKRVELGPTAAQSRFVSLKSSLLTGTIGTDGHFR